MSAEPTLYGLNKSNRVKKDLWGKNQFNSTFPIALSFWMRDNAINPIYLYTDQSFQSQQTELMIFDEVFGANSANEEIFVKFEAGFTPFKEYLYDSLDKIDVVIQNQEHKDIRPLEVKLTVVPDQATQAKQEMYWSSELVIRPVTSSYAILSTYHAMCPSQREKGRVVVEDICQKIHHWDSPFEISRKKEQILETLKHYFSDFSNIQVPFLLQPIWKTVGKSPELNPQCFDVFVWSNFALCKAVIDNAEKSKNETEIVTRPLRESARMLRCLGELHTRGKVDIKKIYREMALGSQTDKAIALSGRDTIRYLSHSRLLEPIVSRETLTQLILNGGEKMLSPERRFDASVYFTCKALFDLEPLDLI